MVTNALAIRIIPAHIANNHIPNKEERISIMTAPMILVSKRHPIKNKYLFLVSKLGITDNTRHTTINAREPTVREINNVWFSKRSPENNNPQKANKNKKVKLIQTFEKFISILLFKLFKVV